MGGTPRRITHLPDFKLIGGDVVEYRLLLLLDCLLQVTDGLRTHDINWKGVRIFKAGNPADERDFGGHVGEYGFYKPAESLLV